MPLPRLTPARLAPPCPQREDDQPCAPLNKVWLIGDGGRLERAYAACTCGRRFGIGTAKHAWRGHWGVARRRLAELEAAGGVLAGPALGEALAAAPPADRQVPRAAPGVVPVGAEVIHRPTAWVDAADPQLLPFAEHMLQVMDAAPGIGLAANQVGVGVRVMALNFPEAIPTVWANPVQLAAEGEWTYDEGCLSLVVEGSVAEVVRPRHVVVVADLPGGGHVVVEADELLARVVQHELDHLEGIEYVQRLEGEERDRVYGVLREDAVPVDLLPAVPYA